MQTQQLKIKKGQSPRDIADSLNLADIMEELVKISTDKPQLLEEPDNNLVAINKNDINEDSGRVRVSVNTANILTQISHNDPFRGKNLTRQETRKMLQNLETVTQNSKKLPVLEGWLEKKKPSPPYSWQKRWVVVKGSHLLWSDRQRTIEDPTKPEQRKLFNGFLNMIVIQEIEPLETKSGKKFVLHARDSKRSGKRIYEWKAPSTSDRDYWVSGLIAHKNNLQLMVNIFDK